jgi:GDP-4-dehydro-6-deoxy-D-mannose reductase
MRALITGGHGFVGRHLAQHLLRCNEDVALTYYPADPGCGNAVEIPTAAQNLALDITNQEMVKEVISLLKPDAVYHLAAISFVPQGEKDFSQVFAINFMGTLNVLEAIAKYSKNSRFLFVSSAEVYGNPRPKSLPLTELSELRPINSYGVSKAAADVAAYKYWYRDKVHVVRIRSFPHIGPGQSDSFAISSFAKQIAAVKLGKAEPVIKVGNLDVKRDYCDVSDIVRGYREAVFNAKPGEAYNLCSGESLTIGELLQTLIKLADVNVEIVQDPARMRKVDIPELRGTYKKANRDFGWRPRVEREAMLDTLLAYWLDTLSK